MESHLEVNYIPFTDQWASLANGTIDVSFSPTTILMSRDVLGVSLSNARIFEWFPKLLVYKAS